MNFKSMFNKKSLAQRDIAKSKTVTKASNLYVKPAPPQKPKDYKVITTAVELLEYFERCCETGYCSFDWETSPDENEIDRWEEELTELMSQRDQYEELVKHAQQTGTASVSAAKKVVDVLDKYINQREEYFKLAPLDPHRAAICTASISAAPHEARVVFLSHEKGTQHFEADMSRDEARALFFECMESEIFRNSTVEKIAYNLAFETKMALKYGCYIGMPVVDPFVMIVRVLQIIDTREILNMKTPSKGKGLKAMAAEFLKVQMREFTTVVDDDMFFNELSTDDDTAMLYSAEDSDYSLQLYLLFDEVAKQIEIERELLVPAQEITLIGPTEEKATKTFPAVYSRPFGNYSEWLRGIEMPFSRVIGQMEFHGFTWNSKKAEEVQEIAEMAMEKATNRISEIGNEIYAIMIDNETLTEEAKLGLENLLNINPGKTGKNSAVRFLLFDVLGCPTPTMSDKTGKPNMDGNAILDMKFMVTHNLTDLRDEKYVDIDIPEESMRTSVHMRAIEIQQSNPYPYKDYILELLDTIQEVAKFGTLLSSHIHGREKFVHPVTGRIHAGFTPWTETARLNSRSPNGQNVPRKDTDPFLIRNVYQAAKDKVLLLIDYATFELRLIAWASKDETMLELFRNNGDMHKKTASTLTGKPDDQITKEERISAKSGNFGIGYGGTAWALQRTYKKFGMRKSLEFCEKVVTAVKATYPNIVPWQQMCAAKSRATGFAETIFGYRRMLPYINSSNRQLRAGDERKAFNTPIQGSAADIMKKSQNAIYDRIAKETWEERYDNIIGTFVHGRVDQIQQFHDELVLEVDNDLDVIKTVVKEVVDIMQQEPLPDFPLQLVVEPDIATHGWGDKEDYYKWLKKQEEQK